MAKRIVFIFIVLNFHILALLAAADDSLKIIALQKEKGIVFVNKGTADGIKERQKIGAVTSSGKNITLTVSEAFGQSSKLSLQDTSDSQYLNEGESLNLKEELSPEITQISAETRTIITEYNRGGQRRNKSFYPPGVNARQEIDLKIKNTALKNVNVEGFISGRATDDKYVDPERLSLEGLYLNIEDKEKKYHINLGDFYSYFSNYSLSQSLKGIKGFYKFQNNLGELSMISLWGTNKHRWNDFWREIDGETYTRYISGARLEQLLNGGNIKLGLNFVDNRDKRKSSSRTANPITNDIISSDLEFKIPKRFFAKAEIAQALTDTNTSAGSSVSTKSDQAYKIDTSLQLTQYDYLNSALSSGYERAGQNFSSLSGILKTDREEYYARLNSQTYDYFSWRLGIIRSRNNLKNGLARTTKYSNGNIGFSLRPVVSKREFEVSLDLDHRRRFSSDTTIKEQSDNARLSLRDKFGALSLWGAWQVSKHDDETTIANGRFSHIVDLGTRLNLDYKNLALSPHLYLQFEKRKQDTTKLDNIFNSLTTGLTMQSRQNLEFSLDYTIADTNDDILLQNRKRQRLEFETQYYLDRGKTRDINLSYTLDKLENKNPARDYSENLVRLEFRQRF